MSKLIASFSKCQLWPQGGGGLHAGEKLLYEQEFQVTMGGDIGERIVVLTGDVWVTSAETISAT